MTRGEIDGLDLACARYDKYTEEYKFWAKVLRVLSKNGPKRSIVETAEEYLMDAARERRWASRDMEFYLRLKKKENENK